MTTNSYLSLISSIFTAINTQSVHATLYPITLGPVLHAARVSTVFQAFARRSPTRLSMGQHIVGFLLMACGGSLLSNWFLGLSVPILHSSTLAFNYIYVHLILTAFFERYPHLLNPQFLDTLLWPLDAILRTNGVTSTIDHLSSSQKVHREYASSPLTHLLIGALVSSGGGAIVGTISGTTANWTFATPPFLRSGAAWDETLDVWGGALVAFIYGTLTGHRAFSSARHFLSGSLPLVDVKEATALTGRVVAATVLGVLFAARVYKAHWWTPVAPPNVAVDASEKRQAAVRGRGRGRGRSLDESEKKNHL